MTKKTISQEAFDEMVQENVETFEMEVRAKSAVGLLG